MAAKIEKTTIIGDVLDIAPETAPLFMAIGMHCLGCPSSRGETVEEACMVHGVDADAFLAQVNRFIEASEEAEKAKAAGITAVVFDRGGNKYTGRVAAVADGAREGGLAL